MKNLLIISLFLVACQSPISEQTAENGTEKPASYVQQIALIQDVADQNLLNGIEQKIFQSFVSSITTQKDEQLQSLKKELATLQKQRNQNIIAYWQGYLAYYHAIFALQTGKKDLAETYTDEGIELLDNLKNKNSEDYAMLALLQSFSTQFKSGFKAPFISSTVKGNTEKAMALDKDNLRAYYVYANSDFYTPEQYGGGKEAEQYLLKAIALQPQKVPNAMLPSWGKEEAYEMLIKFYIRKEKWEQAKKYFQEASTNYPNNYNISKLAAKLIGK